MPVWLQILLQVIQAVLSHLIANPPGPTAPQADHDQHAIEVAKVQSALDTLQA